MDGCAAVSHSRTLTDLISGKELCALHIMHLRRHRVSCKMNKADTEKRSALQNVQQTYEQLYSY